MTLSHPSRTLRGRRTDHRVGALARRTLHTALIATFAASTACGDEHVITAPPSTVLAARNAPFSAAASRQGGGKAIVTRDERAAAERLVRAIAISLRYEPVRDEIRSDLASSTVREHKLHVASYFTGRGNALRGALERDAGISRDELRSLIAQMRELEFYMPVAGHQESWTGGEDVIVAYQLHEAELPIAYDTQGNRRVLSLEGAPTTPVLALVAAEGDFRHQQAENVAGRSEKACKASRAESIAAAAQRCGTNQPSTDLRTTPPGAAPVLQARGNTAKSGRTLGVPSTGMPRASLEDGSDDGLFVTFARVLSEYSGESWIRGKPEYEIHIRGRLSTSASEPYQISCIGGGYNRHNPYTDTDSRYNAYDQNGGFWEGKAKLLNVYAMAKMDSVDGKWTAQLWEDDDMYECEYNNSVEQGQDWLLGGVTSLALGIGLVVGGASGTYSGDDGAILAGIGMIITGIIYTPVGLAAVIIGADDYVGNIVEKQGTRYKDDYANNNYMLVRPVERSGVKDYVLAGRLTFKASGVATPVGPVNAVSIYASAGSPMPAGTTQSLSAYGYDANGRYVGDRAVTWTSSSPSLMSVSSSGVLTVNGAGSATITATVDGVSNTLSLTAAGYGAATRIRTYYDTPLGDTIVIDMDSPGTLGAYGFDANNFRLPEPAWWRSTDPTKVDIDSGGYIVGNSPGNGTIIVSLEDLVDTLHVIVRAHWVTKDGFSIGECMSPGGMDCPVYGYLADHYFDGTTTVDVRREGILFGWTMDNWEYYSEAERQYNEWNPPLQ